MVNELVKKCLFDKIYGRFATRSTRNWVQRVLKGNEQNHAVGVFGDSSPLYEFYNRKEDSSFEKLARNYASAALFESMLD